QTQGNERQVRPDVGVTQVTEVPQAAPHGAQSIPHTASLVPSAPHRMRRWHDYTPGACRAPRLLTRPNQIPGESWRTTHDPSPLQAAVADTFDKIALEVEEDQRQGQGGQNRPGQER